MTEAAQVIVRLQDELTAREARRDESEPAAPQLRRQLDEVRAKLVAEQRASTKLEGALRQQQKTTIELLPYLARIRTLCEVVVTESMFAATEMVAGGGVAFEAMKVDQLKVELAERGSTRSGRKAILQRRLHALLVQAAIEQHGADMHMDF